MIEHRVGRQSQRACVREELLAGQSKQLREKKGVVCFSIGMTNECFQIIVVLIKYLRARRIARSGREDRGRRSHSAPVVNNTYFICEM